MTTEVAYLAIKSRILVLILCFISVSLRPPFDRSGQAGILGLGNWDGVHFSAVALRGYSYSPHSYAFFPLMPVMMRTVGSIFSVTGIPFEYAISLAGVLISNLAFVGAAVALYNLTLRLFQSEQIAKYSAILFCFTPASIFMSAVYTESLYALFSFTGLLLFERNEWLLSSLVFALGSATRSNGMLFIGFFLFSALHHLRMLPKALLCSCIVVSPIVLFQLYARHQLCANDTFPFCDAIYPNVYGYIQSAYWNVGLFNYYEFKQLPNFLLASPMLSLSVYGIYQYTIENPISVFSLGFGGNLQKESHSHHRLIYMYHWGIMLLLCITIVHIQVSTRFIATSPHPYWFAAYMFHNRHQFPILTQLYTIWASLFFVLGCVMFSLFLPWT